MLFGRSADLILDLRNCDTLSSCWWLSENLLMTKGCCTCLVFCSATLTASEMPHISASNISLFWPRLVLSSCHSSLLRFFFHTTAAPVPLVELRSVTPKFQIRCSCTRFMDCFISSLNDRFSKENQSRWSQDWLGSPSWANAASYWNLPSQTLAVSCDPFIAFPYSVFFWLLVRLVLACN